MAELKTQKNDGSVSEFLDDINRETLSELVQQSARHMAESNA